jgi:iron complex outermembrane receptor protein
VAQDDGYMHNIAPGQPDLGNQDLYSVRGQLKFQLSEDLTLSIKADVHEDDNNGPGGKLLGTLSGEPGIPERFLGGIAASDKFSTASDIDSYYKTDLKGASAKLEWELENVKLTSISAYRDSSIENLFDADFTTFPHQYVLFDDTSKHFSQEFRLASNYSGRVDWIVGAYYFEDESSQLVDTGVTDVPISLDPLLMVPFHASLGGDLDTTSQALFGNATWRAIEDKLNLQAGVRYTRDEKEIDEFNAIEIGPFPPIGGSANQDESWSEVTYLAGVEYFPLEKTMLYANVSTGFKAGGFNAGALTPAFDPETALNFELGLKSRFLDDRADVSLAVFNTDYEDLQVAQVVNLTVIVDNAAQARLRGVELEGTVALTQAFHLSGSLAILEAEFEEYQTLDQANPGAGVQDLEGRNLPNAPEFTMSLVPEYTFDIASYGSLTIYGAYSYQSRVYLDQFNNLPFSQESVELYDVGATFMPYDGAIAVSVFGKNLTDEEVMNSLFVSSAITLSVGSAGVSPGRTYGVRIEYNF